jgi:hypothetical protein
MSAVSANTATGTIQQYIAQTYFGLRLVLALLAFSFPWLLYFGARLAGYGWESSLSAFYEAHNGLMRDGFVGVLWAVGMMLLAYRGLHIAESAALLVAGVAAIGIASFACHCVSESDPHSGWHTFFAILFFACITYICLFHARDTLTLLPADVKPPAATFRTIYLVIGVLMIALPMAAVLLDHFLGGGKAVLGAEIAGIYVFGAYWCVKSWELGKSDAERDIARGRIVRVHRKGLVRLPTGAAAAPRSLVYPATVADIADRGRGDDVVP